MNPPTTSPTDPANDAGRGMHLACDVVEAIANNEDGRALGLLNAAGEAENRWAAAAMASMIREIAQAFYGNNPRKVRQALTRAVTAGRYQDAVVTAAMVAAQAGERDG